MKNTVIKWSDLGSGKVVYRSNNLMDAVIWAEAQTDVSEGVVWYTVHDANGDTRDHDNWQ